MGGQGTCRRNIAENLNRLSMTHERYRRQTDGQMTDGRATANSKNLKNFLKRRFLRPWFPVVYLCLKIAIQTATTIVRSLNTC